MTSSKKQRLERQNGKSRLKESFVKCQNALPTTRHVSRVVKMELLNLNNINMSAPYSIWRQGKRYYFKTDNDIIYMVSFDKEEAFQEDKAYWFNLSNTSDRKSPRDHKIRETIFALLEDFFNENPDILLYICDTIDNQQAQRERLFLSWFNRYGKGRFTIITAKVSSGDEDEYVAMILQNNHPHYDAITHQFKKEIAMFKENK